MKVHAVYIFLALLAALLLCGCLGKDFKEGMDNNTQVDPSRINNENNDDKKHHDKEHHHKEHHHKKDHHDKEHHHKKDHDKKHHDKKHHDKEHHHKKDHHKKDHHKKDHDKKHHDKKHHDKEHYDNANNNNSILPMESASNETSSNAPSSWNNIKYMNTGITDSKSGNGGTSTSGKGASKSGNGGTSTSDKGTSKSGKSASTSGNGGTSKSGKDTSNSGKGTSKSSVATTAANSSVISTDLDEIEDDITSLKATIAKEESDLQSKLKALTSQPSGTAMGTAVTTAGGTPIVDTSADVVTTLGTSTVSGSDYGTQPQYIITNQSSTDNFDSDSDTGDNNVVYNNGMYSQSLAGPTEVVETSPQQIFNNQQFLPGVSTPSNVSTQPFLPGVGSPTETLQPYLPGGASNQSFMSASQGPVQQYSSNLQMPQNPQGISGSQIPAGQEDMYILKSQIVPPVCPACPTVCPAKKNCPPCPAPARCPEPGYKCKLIPNFNSPENLPRPVLNDFSQFGM